MNAERPDQQLVDTIVRSIDWTPTVIVKYEPGEHRGAARERAEREAIVRMVLSVAAHHQAADLSRARELHLPYPSTVPPQCRTCVDLDEDPTPWPCQTAAALGASVATPFTSPWGVGP